MIERDRVLMSTLGAVGLHVALFIGLSGVDWTAISEEQSAPAYVQLEEIAAAESPDSDQTTDEPEQPEEPDQPEEQQPPQPEEPEEPPQREPQPQPASEPDPEPQQESEPEPEPQPEPEREPEPQPEPQPVPQSEQGASAAAAQAQGREAPPSESSQSTGRSRRGGPATASSGTAPSNRGGAQSSSSQSASDSGNQGRQAGSGQSGGAGEGGSQSGSDPAQQSPPGDMDLSADALQGNDDIASTGPAFRTRGGRSGSQSTPRVQEAENPEATLPEWVRNPSSETDSSEQRMSREQARELARKIEADPEFRNRLRSVLSRLEEQRSRSSRQSGAEGPDRGDNNAGPGEGGAPGADNNEGPGSDNGSDNGTDNGTGPGSGGPGSGPDGTSETPGNRRDAAIQWSSTTGGRGVPGRLPDLTPADFGGRVPGETTFVVVFEVDRTGTVVPGSIIFQQQSIHPRANEKLRSAIRQWTFAEKPQAQRETAIFSLTVQRSDVEQTN